MALVETSYVDVFEHAARNALYEYARRSGQLDNIGSFYATVTQDESTGRPLVSIYSKDDSPKEPEQAVSVPDSGGEKEVLS